MEFTTHFGLYSPPQKWEWLCLTQELDVQRICAEQMGENDVTVQMDETSW